MNIFHKSYAVLRFFFNSCDVVYFTGEKNDTNHHYTWLLSSDQSYRFTSLEEFLLVIDAEKRNNYKCEIIGHTSFCTSVLRDDGLHRFCGGWTVTVRLKWLLSDLNSRAHVWHNKEHFQTWLHGALLGQWLIYKPGWHNFEQSVCATAQSHPKVSWPPTLLRHAYNQNMQFPTFCSLKWSLLKGNIPHTHFSSAYILVSVHSHSPTSTSSVVVGWNWIFWARHEFLFI